MIYITGDTHGEIDIKKLDEFAEKHKELTKEDYVIVCGDIAVCWYGIYSDISLQLKYRRYPFTTLFCDGNHENHKLLNSYTVRNWCGGKVHLINESLIHLMRGEIYNIDGKTFWVMGGADSIDKEYRTPNESWWKEELPSKREFTYAEKKLQDNEFKVDYVISHCCSARTQRLIDSFYKNDKLTYWFNDIEAQLEYKHWYFGHYHIDKTLDEKHTCLYDEIVELGKTL